MKPTIFLSHSKQDRPFIEKLANDLRVARVSVWYDEWEIPPGESFRRQIFEAGIPNSDLFFIYLTPAAASSYWVSRELDAAFVRDAESRGGYLALFVDSDATRATLSPDLRSLHSPVLNAQEYDRPLWQLISRSWEAALTRQVAHAKEHTRIEVLELQKALAEQEARIVRLQAAGVADLARVKAQLDAIKLPVTLEGESLTAVFAKIARLFALGPWPGSVMFSIADEYGFANADHLSRERGVEASDVLGPLVIYGLVRVELTKEGESVYCLTDLGRALAAELGERTD